MDGGFGGVSQVGSAGAPIVVKLVEDLPEMAPVIIRNAEGAVQVGKTAINIAKGVGLTIGAGVLVGTGAVLFVGSALGTVWAFGKAGEKLKDKWLERKNRIAAEEAAKNATPAQA